MNRLNQKKSETFQVESGWFWKEVNKEEYKDEAELNLTHTTPQGGVSTEFLLGLPFLFPSSLEECKTHFAKLLRGGLCLSHQQLLGSGIPASLPKGKVYGDPAGPGVTHRARTPTRPVRIKLHFLQALGTTQTVQPPYLAFKQNTEYLTSLLVFVVFPK